MRSRNFSSNKFFESDVILIVKCFVFFSAKNTLKNLTSIQKTLYLYQF